jgi:competence protein ComEA
MSSPFKDFFHYSRGERRGALLLLTILLIVLVFYFLQQCKSTYPEAISQTDQVSIKRFSSNDYKFEKSTASLDSIDYFKFDPNTIGVTEWKQLGFSEKQAQSIEKYKNSGAQFFKKEDLKKLYVVDDAKYQQLKPYIAIEAFESKKKANYKDYKYDKKDYPENDYGKPRYRIVTIAESAEPIYSGLGQYTLEVRYARTEDGYKYVVVANLDSLNQMSVLKNTKFENLAHQDISSLKGYYPIVAKADKEPQKVIEINTADTTEIKSLRGIGSSFAARIIKYRIMMGGFHSKYQLMEVYGLDEEKYKLIKEFITVNADEIVQININKAIVDELKSHPYINWKVANSIFFYRKAHGNYTQVEDIKNSDLINEELFSKIAHYITVQ